MNLLYDTTLMLVFENDGTGNEKAKKTERVSPMSLSEREGRREENSTMNSRDLDTCEEYECGYRKRKTEFNRRNKAREDEKV